MKAKIAEVFESVQGEGLYFGEKQLFVRFFGCDVNCRFCDTDLDSFMEYEPQELIEEIGLYDKNIYHSISFTGGEPLLQKDFLKEVLPLTAQSGYKNYLETNGILHHELKEVIDYVDIVAMDVKLPSSTGRDNFWQEHCRFLEVAGKKEVFLKAIICRSTQEKDLQEAIVIIKESNSSPVLVLQPNTNELDEHLAHKLEIFREICTKNDVTACVIPQMHKLAYWR